jgi:Flp pilus assembly protein TadG
MKIDIIEALVAIFLTAAAAGLIAFGIYMSVWR